MRFDEALAFLDRHINLEAQAGRVEGLSLDRMVELASLLGDPQQTYPVIHVTGTNGKGSTSHLITRLLLGMGLRVGTYASPHVASITERISLNGQPVAEATFADLIGAVAPFEALLSRPPSYFELVTAAALTHFADEAVDVAVVEVGVLGRYDATNVCDAAVAVVTNVTKDHTDGAEGWRRRIAEEKAGIIKPGATLVLGETEPGLRAIFLAEPAGAVYERERHFACLGNDVAVGGRLVDLQGPFGRYEDVFLSLHGSHQGDNAAIAVAAVEGFFARALPDDVVREALGGAAMRGRFEIVGRQPLVVLDAAHNVEGAKSLRGALDGAFPHARRHIVFGMLGPRDPGELLAALGADDASSLVLCEAPSPRAVPLTDLAHAARALGIEPVLEATPSAAYARALTLADPDDLVVVTGSFTVLGALPCWPRDARSASPGAGPER